MKKLLLLLLLTTYSATAQILDPDAPTPFPDGLKLENLDEQNESDEILVRDGDGVVGYILKNLEVVETISELEAYEGSATTLIVSDTLRGGVFNLHNTTENIDNTFTFSHSDSGVWKRQVSNSESANVMWNPDVDNTGQNDNLQAFLNVYNSAKEKGFTEVFHPAGTYYIDNTLDAPTNLHYYGAGKGKTILTFDGNGADEGFFVQGNYQEIGKLDEIAVNNQDSIVLETSVNLEPNDVLVVSDTTEDSYYENQLNGEFLLVKDSIDSENVTIQQNILSDSFPIGSNVYKIEKNWFRMSDMTLIGNRTLPDPEPPIYEYNSGLKVILVQDAELKNVDVSNVNSVTVVLDNVFGGIVENCDINQTYLLEDRTGSEFVNSRYGLALPGSQNINVKNNNIYANRHAIDMGGNGSGFVAGTSVPVISRNIHIEKNNIEAFRESAGNNHSGEYIDYVNNIIVGGVNISGNHNSLIKNTISVPNEENPVQPIHIASALGSDFNIRDNKIFGNNHISTSTAMLLSFWQFLPSLENIDPLIIDNNTFIQEEIEDGALIINVFNPEGYEYDLYFENNKLYNRSDNSARVSLRGSGTSKSRNLKVNNSYFENVVIEAVRYKNVEIKSNSTNNIHHAVKLTDIIDAKLQDNNFISNTTLGEDDEENSVINVDGAENLIVNANTYDANNNDYLINATDVTNLVRGSRYVVSGSESDQLTNVDDEKTYEYFFENIRGDYANLGTTNYEFSPFSSFTSNSGIGFSDGFIETTDYLSDKAFIIGANIIRNGGGARTVNKDGNVSELNISTENGLRFRTEKNKIQGDPASLSNKFQIDLDGNGLFEGTVTAEPATEDDELATLGQVKDKYITEVETITFGTVSPGEFTTESFTYSGVNPGDAVFVSNVYDHIVFQGEVTDVDEITIQVTNTSNATAPTDNTTLTDINVNLLIVKQ